MQRCSLVSILNGPRGPIATHGLSRPHCELCFFCGVHQHGHSTCCVGLVVVVAPEGVVPVGVLVGDSTVQGGRDIQAVHSLEWGDRQANRRSVGRGHADKPFGLEANPCTVGKRHLTGALQQAVFHVQHPLEPIHLCGRGQVQGLAIHLNSDARPVGGIENLGEVLGIPILPPAHFRSVRVIHPSHVASQHVVSRIAFLVVGALAKPTVANGKNALRTAHVGGIESLFHHAPSFRRQVTVHVVSDVVGRRLRRETQALIQVRSRSTVKPDKSGTTLSASESCSSSPTPTAKNPPVLAAFTPEAASSNTTIS